MASLCPSSLNQCLPHSVQIIRKVGVEILHLNCAIFHLGKNPPIRSYKLIGVSTNDVDNFKRLDAQWASKLDFLDDVYEVDTLCRIVVHKDQEEELTKFLAETGFEHSVLIENMET